MSRSGLIAFAPAILTVVFMLGGCWNDSSQQAGSASYIITSILLDPSSCSLDGATGLVDCPTVYAATAGGGIFKSLDGGGSWTRIVDGLIEWNISELVMDPKNPAILYAGTENNGLFKTTDGGAFWFNPSTSGGIAIKSITAIAVDPFSTPCSPSPCIYVGSEESGVWKSENEGLSWTQMNSGLIETTVTALTLFSYTGSPSVLYAGTEGGHLYKFNPISEKWEEPLQGGLSEKTTASPLVIAVNPFVPTDLYVGTSGGEGESTGGTFRSIDGGLSWSAVPIPNAQNFSVRVLAFCVQVEPNCPPILPDETAEGDDLREPDVLYAGVYGLSKNNFTGVGSWTNIFTANDLIEFGNNVSSLAIDTLRHTTLYAGTLSGFVIKSQDAGATWTRHNINAP